MRNDARKIVLGELAEIRQGYPFRGAIADVPRGPVAVVQMKDLSPLGLKSCDDLIRTEISSRREPDWLREHDIIFAARGTSNYACAVAGIPPQTVCSPHLYVIRVNQPVLQLLPEFLAWQFNQRPIQRYLAQSAEGSVQLSIRRSVLVQAEIRVPSIEQQRTIVALGRLATNERNLLQAMIRNRETELATIAEQLLG